MSEHNPDDIQDVVEMMNDLSLWLYDRREKFDVRKMAFMLIVKASEIITTYKLEKPNLIFEKGIEFGQELGMERKDS